MKTEIICAIIALAGTAISGLLSWFVSRTSATKEIEKLKLTWEHENSVTSDDEFADMVAAVALCIQEKLPASFDSAISRVAAVRSKERGSLANRLDDLYHILFDISPNSGIVDFYGRDYQEQLRKVNECLSQVIEEKRKNKSGQHGTRTQKPTK